MVVVIVVVVVVVGAIVVIMVVVFVVLVIITMIVVVRSCWLCFTDWSGSTDGSDGLFRTMHLGRNIHH